MKKDIFIFSSGELKREENTLCFKSEKTKKFIPISNVSSILIFNEISFNKKLLEFISSNGVLIHFFNYYGYYIGSFYPRTHYNSAFMTLKQCEHYLDVGKRIKLARKFVEGGLKNMIKILKYYENRGINLTDTITHIEKCLNKIFEAETIETLMAIEGNARENYFLSFNKIVRREGFSFEKRERPPKSYLNTLVSFGNSLLYVTILGEIYKTHLDPRIGFLHTANYRKFSLNLDLAEIFKPVIVDRIIFTLINKNIIDISCFVNELEGLYLNEKGRKIFIEEYDKKLHQTVSFKKQKKCSYQRLIRLELYKIEKHLIGEHEYEPFVLLW